MRIIHTTLVLALFASSAATQQVVHESLTGTPWAHSTGGTWLNGITESRSAFNKVDHLVSASAFTYTRSPLLLEAGTYLVVARFAKMVNTTYAAPIDLNMIVPFNKVLTTSVSAQTLGKFIHTRAMTFTLSTKSPVLFSISNLDTTKTKADYYFDSFHVGMIPEGQVVLTESLGRRWTHNHAAPHYLREVADSTANFGFCDALASQQGNGLWWFDWTSGVKQFSTGIHTFNLRIKKIVSVTGASNFDLWVSESTDNGTTWKAGSKIVWTRGSHVLNKWVESPNYVFNVSNANNLYRFYWHKYSGSDNGPKSDYHFDSFTVRKGEFTPFGVSCIRSGRAKMKGTIPQLGRPFEIRCGPFTSATPLTMILGLASANFDLALLGWPGCYQYARMDLLVPMPMVKSLAKINLIVPNTPGLLGVPFYTQAYKVSPAGGIKTSNGVRGVIGN